MTSYGGRRFLLVAGCGLVYTALLISGYITGSEFVTLQIATVAAYIAGNGAQKYAETRYGNGNHNPDQVG